MGEFANHYEALINGLSLPLKDLVAQLKGLKRTLTVVSLASCFQIDPDASEEFRNTVAGLILPPEQWEKMKQIRHINLKEVVLKEGKRGAAVVVTPETGPVGMTVHLDMNPAWAEEILDVITPIDDLSP